MHKFINISVAEMLLCPKRSAPTMTSLTPQERSSLGSRVRTENASFRAVERVRLVLLLAEGMAFTAIAWDVGLFAGYGRTFSRPNLLADLI